MYFGESKKNKTPGPLIYTTQELANIESWRDEKQDATKYVVISLLGYENRYLRSIGQSERKSECFCAIARRKQYRKEFYTLWNNRE